jgi:DNA-binding CsgD family transcriptional regulator
MAGPGKSGPPRKGQEEVEFARLKADVIRMRSANMTHAEIARRTGLSRPSVTQMLPRIYREFLVEAGVEDLLAIQFRRCERVIEEFWSNIIAPTSFDEKLKAAETVFKFMKREADLFGLDAGKRIDLKVSDNNAANANAETIADNVERFMDLADKLVKDGIGSGRVMLTTRPDGVSEAVDADLVEENARCDLRPFSLAELAGEGGGPIRTPEPPAPPTQDWREFLSERQLAREGAGRHPQAVEVEERPPGRWFKGRFIPLEEGVEVVST